MQELDRTFKPALNFSMALPKPNKQNPESNAAISSRVTLAQLRAFVAVVDSGRYSEAALSLEMAQSTLSHNIKELERTLGKRLLDRGRHGANLTAFGCSVLEHARDALIALESLEQTVHLEREGLYAKIRIASMRSTLTHVLPAVIQRFRQQHTNVRFELIEEESYPNGVEGLLHDARADLGIMNLGLLHERQLIAFPLFTDEYMVLWQENDRQIAPNWQEITAQPLIECRDLCWSLVKKHWQDKNQKLEPAYLAVQDSAILSMVAHGLGISFMPSLACHPLPKGVLAFPLPDRLQRQIGVVTTRAKAASPAVKTFIQALRAFQMPD